jgi:hypothetical protein
MGRRTKMKIVKKIKIVIKKHFLLKKQCDYPKGHTTIGNPFIYDKQLKGGKI